MNLADDISDLPDGARVLLLAPGPYGMDFVGKLAVPEGRFAWTILHDYSLREGIAKVPWAASDERPAFFFHAKVARLPFQPRTFDGVLALETLFAVRPPWTVLAELHRVLKPGGRLVMLEPADESFFSMLRARLLGPGKRVYPIEELTRSLQRADFRVDGAQTLAAGESSPIPANLVRASKVENAAEAAPEVITTRDLRARQQKPAAS